MNRPDLRRLRRTRPRPLRRSLLFMPGDSAHKIEKAARLDVDSIIMDLEDGVAVGRKEVARETIAEAARRVDFGQREVLVRINPVDSDYAIDDLRATVDLSPQGYVVPKVEDPEHLAAVSRFIADVESAQGRPSEGIRLLALIETAKGVMNLREIAAATSRLDALIFGAEDLASDLGAIRTRAGWEVFYARSAVVTAAAAYNLQAIDTVFVALDDQEGLQDECTLARQMGYIGKLAIHPRQLPAINETFAPSEAEISAALRLIQLYEENQSAGRGAFQLDGKMVDMPMLRVAQRTVDSAKALGLHP